MALGSALLPGSTGLLGLFFSLCLCYIIYSLALAIYNITLHPLAKFPGPLLRGAFYFPLYWEIWTGDMTTNSQALHDEYGNTVRTSPSSLSFNNAEAWQEIYGQRQGKKSIPKDPEVYVSVDGIPDIILSNDVDHARIRRLLSHAFSEGALQEQESLQNVYFDLLIRKLHNKIDSPLKGKVNMVRWFNFATFDLIGDLSFGESFEALETEEYNSWLGNIVSGFKFSRLFRIFRAYPLIGVPILFAISQIPSFDRAWKKHEEYTKEKASRRLDSKTDRRDLMSYILRYNDDRGMSRDEIMKTSSTLIIAGSETTATMLSGTLYHLLCNPSTLERLTQEIRSNFPDPKEINFVKLQSLKYLNACLQEGFRIYPPVPMVLPRRTLPGGAMVNGRFIPENISVGIHQWSAYHSATNFTDPDKYIPERWLNEPRFVNDNRAVLQPFSVGPRNCIGRHLAMAQMRSILARVLWHFDISLCEESRGWVPQKVFLLWDKPDLMVKLAARTREVA